MKRKPFAHDDGGRCWERKGDHPREGSYPSQRRQIGGIIVTPDSQSPHKIVGKLDQVGPLNCGVIKMIAARVEVEAVHTYLLT